MLRKGDGALGRRRPGLIVGRRLAREEEIRVAGADVRGSGPRRERQRPGKAG